MPKSKDWRDWPFMAGERRAPGRRWLLPASSAHRRRDQRRRSPARHERNRVGVSTVPEIAEAAVVPCPGRVEGARARGVLSRSSRWCNRARRVVDRVIKAKERGDRPDRANQARVHRSRHAQDALREKSCAVVLAAISNRRDVGDVTTLANPDVSKTDPHHGTGKDVSTTQEALPEDHREVWACVNKPSPEDAMPSPPA